MRATASEMRAPVAYSSSISALSRRAAGSSPSVAASNCSTCSMVSAFGRRAGCFGATRSTAGSASSSPSSTRNPANPRIDEIVRAIDDAASGCGRSRSPRTYAASATGSSAVPASSIASRSRRYAATVFGDRPFSMATCRR